jgi:hypothetical protein
MSTGRSAAARAEEEQMSQQRSAQEVLDDHLDTSLNGALEDDLERNYAQDVTIVSNWGIKHGHDGVRELAQLLRSQLPDSTLRTRCGWSRAGSVCWCGRGTRLPARCGTVSTPMSIRAQTIHDTLTPSG